MRKKLIFIFPVLMILFQSCKKSIDVNNLQLLNKELNITFWYNDSSIQNKISINKVSNGSKELENITEWLTKNLNGWEDSIVSYAEPKISLSNENFRLLIFTDFVIIGYLDNNNNAKQLTKKIDLNEFAFLNQK
tara:strand:+ start:551 stop:952 length:402 start_codon:yes stop_codon:yes gene_type:complete